MSYLNRKQAAIADSVWEMIDEAAIGAARSRLTARRFLDVDGPFGPGQKIIT